MLQLNVLNILASQCVYIVRGKGDVVYVFFLEKTKVIITTYLFKKNFCQENLIFSTHFFNKKVSRFIHPQALKTTSKKACNIRDFLK